MQFGLKCLLPSASNSYGGVHARDPWMVASRLGAPPRDGGVGARTFGGGAAASDEGAADATPIGGGNALGGEGATAACSGSATGGGATFVRVATRRADAPRAASVTVPTATPTRTPRRWLLDIAAAGGAVAR